jgi:hypothetical protein
VRHAREIDDDRFAADRLAEAQRQPRRGRHVFVGGEQLAQIDLLARNIRQLDADHVAPGHHRDAGGERTHRPRDVVGEADHTRRLDPRRRLELVERHHRSRPRIDDRAADAEIAEHVLERGRGLLDRLGARRVTVGGFRRGQ